jgi:hypothetical protein
MILIKQRIGDLSVSFNRHWGSSPMPTILDKLCWGKIYFGEWAMNRTVISGLSLILFVGLIGCSSKKFSPEGASSKARVEMIATAKSDGIDVRDMNLVNIRKNMEIDVLEVYFENQSKKYRLNIPVDRYGKTEVHKLKE